MARFETERQAKEYLIERLVAEAQHEGAPLTDVERKMLYFSETGWSLPNILDVNAEFERDYDTGEYEQRILALATKITQRDKFSAGEDLDSWYEAVQKLSEGDHYLLVLIDKRLVGNAPSPRPPGDLIKLVLTAIGVLALAALTSVLVHR
jgi:hypothetical protein